ncbi:MAG: SEL1-like repeat protein [Thermoguttaceae bacterium]|nr:SEL1-like repeat protein [Thermoguttaceae bacterium]
MKLVEDAVAGGASDAACWLGLTYQLGNYVAKDEAKAAAWFRKAADLGAPLGM